MPLIFPSHQGLVSPIWRKWPAYFDVTALYVGAAMPDVTDGLIGVSRGYLGQDYGHTLLGLFLLCLPGGLVLTWIVNGLEKHAPRWLLSGAWPAWFKRIGHHLESLPNYTPLLNSKRWPLWSFSVWIGAFSHLLFDLISHGSFLWFYPWYENSQLLPAWWYVKWAEIPLPFYREPYPISPHTLVWIALSIVGVILFFRPLSQQAIGMNIEGNNPS